MSDDLISRQAAIEYFVTNVGFHDEDGYPIEDADELRKIWTEYFDGIPSAQTDLIAKMQNGIKATDADDAYSCGMRNGMRWCISLINDKEPLYESCPPVQPDVPDTNVGDMISRQAAIDALNGEISITGRANAEAVRGYVRLVKDRLERLPSAQPEQRWIPCSERLPEPRIDVWCNSDMGQMVGYYEENVETWYGRDYLELMVTAWMPLPEPYKGGEQDG